MTAAVLHRCDAPGCRRLVSPLEVVTVAGSMRGAAGVVVVAGEACGARCAFALLSAVAARYGSAGLAIRRTAAALELAGPLPEAGDA